jgi:hypothetical protein
MTRPIKTTGFPFAASLAVSLFLALCVRPTPGGAGEASAALPARGSRAKKPPKTAPYGTWVNPSYETNGTKSSKIVYNTDGTWVSFDRVRESVPSHTGTISIWDHWKDKGGCHWYKVTTSQAGVRMPVYELWRIDKRGFVLEGVWCCGSMPACIDAGDPTYTVYYRQNSSGSAPPPVSVPQSSKEKGKVTV